MSKTLVEITYLSQSGDTTKSNTKSTQKCSENIKKEISELEERVKGLKIELVNVEK